MKALKTNLKSYFPPFLFGAVAGLLATGCQTYQQQNKISIWWQQGNLTNAVTVATQRADQNAQNKNAIVWRLEEGAVLRAAGQYEASNLAFDKAQDQIDIYSEKAKVRLGQETAAMLSNQAQLAYEGRSYDGIMLNTYKALNYLALGQPGKARPEFIHAYERQQDAEEMNKKRIEKIQDAAEKNKNKEAIQKAQSDEHMQSQLSNITSRFNNVKVYANYENPFVVYLDGLYFLANANDASDLERARKSFERVTAFAPDDDFVKEDIAAATDSIQGKPLPPVTYVIFETGCAPVRDQIRIDIPTFWPELPYLGAAFPILRFETNYIPNLTVTANGTNVISTMPLGSMDSIISFDFKNELPTVITKTLISTTAKAVATHFAWEATRKKRSDGTLDDGGIGGGLVIISCVTWAAMNNIADERTWMTLPKEFQVARLSTPEDRKIDLIACNGTKTSVAIADGTLNVVYVKSINASTPLLVSQFKLK